MFLDVLKTIASYLLKCILVILCVVVPFILLYAKVIPHIHSSAGKYFFSIACLALSGTLLYMLGRVLYHKDKEDLNKK